jgi:hypothetical protein
MKLEIYRHIFEKYSNIKFHENPINGSQVVACERRTDMTKQIVTFRSFANPPNKIKEREQRSDLKVVCSFYINRIRPK